MDGDRGKIYLKIIMVKDLKNPSHNSKDNKNKIPTRILKLLISSLQ